MTQRATIFEVIEALERVRIPFRLARDRPDTIRVDATLVGMRLEIECFEDGQVEMSTFKGTEDIDGGYDDLLQVLREYAVD
jgi:hypothetical protein